MPAQSEAAVMNRTPAVIAASVATAMLIALVWLRAPLIPVMIGALGAGLVLLRAKRRRRAT